MFEWHEWFAWRPTRVGAVWVWLEVIERKANFPPSPSLVQPVSWQYRFVGGLA